MITDVRQSIATPDQLDERSRLVRRAEELVPLLRKHAPAADRDRRVSQECIDAVAEAELFRVWTPRRWGGFEADMRTQLDVIAALAQGCASTAWIGSVVTGGAFAISRFSAEAQEEVWGDNPDELVCGVLTPAGRLTCVPGGYRFSGEFGWASGSYYTKWARVSVPMVDDDGAEVNQAYMLVPMSDLTIKDTWFTVGMRGTCSNTLVAEDVFVPEHRMLPMLTSAGQLREVATGDGSGLYHVPIGSMISLWILGVPLGIGKAAVQSALEQLPRRSIGYSVYKRQIEAVTTQIELAEASTKVDLAYLLGRGAADEADRVANYGETIDLLTRGRIRMHCSYAARNVREAVDQIIQICGASSMAESNPLQQVFRDISTVTLHAFVRPSLMAEVYGRVLCGLEPTVTTI